MRDENIDILRGICAISIVLIHTTFWSGESYVPQYIQSLSLLIDVPAFFFISGLTLAYTKNFNPSGVIFKLILYFGVVIFFYDLVVWLIHGGNFSNTLNALSLNGFDTKYLPTLGGSYWFVSVFCVVSIISSVILIYLRKLHLLIAILCLSLYIIAFFSSFSIKGSFLGVGLNYCCFYLGIMLLGFFIGERGLLKSVAAPFMICGILALALLYAINPEPSILNMQSNKFFPKLPYILFSFIGIGSLILLARMLNKWGGESQLKRFISFAGRNAILFYVAQGISSSLLFKIVSHIHWHWSIKLVLLFSINLFLCVIFVIILLYIFKPINKLIAMLK